MPAQIPGTLWHAFGKASLFMMKFPDIDNDGPVFDLDTMPSFTLNHVVHRYHQVLQSRLRSAGVSTLKMRIIVSLRSFGSLTVSELCNWAIAEQPTMSRALDSLEGQGIVQRQAGDTDSRLRMISLTEPGRQLFDRIYPEISRVNEAMVEGLSAQEQAAMLSALQRVLGNLQKL
ncbi:MarR family winged helix-turn-helix transcriptional regulator [Paracoccus albus]|uniref:MarR family winged helix-turn-helix transcriptional regulator n=1 Tax=Paracoccus albus TaxID=3017784 RepID=UPI0022F02FF3|nr:MarR family transcriptional regulator [Paracoccus albus]WBU58867.1 MarR family transcriptional regulator [Paracoccus albus]